MIITGATSSQLHRALEITNKDYEDNLMWNNFECLSATRYRVTLRVKDSKGKGARRSHRGRRLISACWHVHGDFFDTLMLLVPEVKIRVSTHLITKDGGNWQDRDIGSIMEPLLFSDACDCNKPTTREVPQGHLTAECWIVQFQGIKACDTCQFKDKKNCGGQDIRKSGKNELGYKVPLGKSI